MFNYNDLKVTLQVSPEVSPVDFYTKEEANALFIQDTPEYTKGGVYGRSHGEWVKIDGDFDHLLAGFSTASTIEALLTDTNIEKLDSYAYILNAESTAENIKIKEINPDKTYTLWICTVDTLKSVTTEQNLPIDIKQEGTLEYKEQTFNAYKIEGLNPGEYILNIAIEK